MAFPWARVAWLFRFNCMPQAVLFLVVCFMMGGCRESEEPKYNKDSFEIKSYPIMPNVVGFLPAGQKGNEQSIQGAWYWYDGPYSRTTEVYATPEEPNGPDDRYFWLTLDDAGIGTASWPPNSKTKDDTRTAKEICAKGYVGEGTDPLQLAVGFELCSHSSTDDQPYDLPLFLGKCDIATDLYKRLKGISFDITKTEGTINGITIQYKEWGRDDDGLQPEDYLDGPFKDKNINLTSFLADATSRDTDAPQANPFMLQAIHIHVSGNKNEEVGFCVSNVRAIVSTVPGNEIGDTDRPPAECDEMDSSLPAFDIDAGWVPITSNGEDFEIMKKEVTVAQFHRFLVEEADGGDPEMDYGWESCNVHLFDIGDTDQKDRAANCVTWCKANRFCKSINGSLPTDEQWKTALTKSESDESTTCKGGAVVNDLNEFGAGCGNDRMPEEGCSRRDAEICDMIGNLSEWVEAPTISDLPWEWMEGYQVARGGSLYSMMPSLTMDSVTDFYTWEHPSMPHSPTRLGFRCIRPSK